MQTFLESELPEEFCQHLFLSFSNKGPKPSPSSLDKPRVSGKCWESDGACVCDPGVFHGYGQEPSAAAVAIETSDVVWNSFLLLKLQLFPFEAEGRRLPAALADTLFVWTINGDISLLWEKYQRDLKKKHIRTETPCATKLIPGFKIHSSSWKIHKYLYNNIIYVYVSKSALKKTPHPQISFQTEVNEKETDAFRCLLNAVSASSSFDL